MHGYRAATPARNRCISIISDIYNYSAFLFHNMWNFQFNWHYLFNLFTISHSYLLHRYSCLFLLCRSRISQTIDFSCYTFHCIFQFKGLFCDHVVLIFTALNNECGSLRYEPYCILFVSRNESNFFCSYRLVFHLGNAREFQSRPVQRGAHEGLPNGYA